MDFKALTEKAIGIAQDEAVSAEDVAWIDNVLSNADGGLTPRDQQTISQYFWGRAVSELWLLKLKRHITECPPVIVTTSGYQVPVWVGEPYLSRLIAKRSRPAFDFLFEIHTNNPRFYEVVIQAALAYEPAVAASVTPLLSDYAENPYGFGKVDFAKVIERFAKLGLIAEAVRLCASLVQFCSDPIREEKAARRAADPEDWSTRLEPRPKLDQWAYQEILEKGVKPLAEAAPLETAKMLAEVVADMIQKRLYEQERGSEIWSDYSEIWCKRVDEPDSNHVDTDEALVHTLTHACVQVYARISDNHEKLAELDNALRATRWRIFQRIREHLYALYPVQAKEWIREVVLSYPNYLKWEYRYEFQRMIRVACAHFKSELFTQDELIPIFDSILSGPDKEDFKSFMGERFTEELFLQQERNFHLRQFRPFEPVIFGKYKETYDAALAEASELPADADYAPYKSEGVKTGGSRSPKPIDELKTMSDDELVAFLNSWEEARRDEKEWWIDINFDGVGIVLRELIKADPSRFLGWGTRWHSIERPIYLRYALDEGCERIKAGQHSELPQWLDLCDWVMAKSDGSIQGEQKPQEWSRTNPDWNSVRRAVVDFVGTCVSTEVNISVEWRDRLHRLLSTACCAPDPYLDRDEAIITPRDYLTDAINTARGRALENLISFGWWVRRHAGDKAPTPEVFQLLEFRLTSGPALTKPEHALLGSQFPRICGLNPDWAKQRRDLLFPHQSLDTWMAAFSSYLRYTRPYPVLFPVFEPEFQFALQHIRSLKTEKDERRDMTDALGQHIEMYYVWGLIGLDDKPSMLRAFYENTEPKNWAALFDHVGRSLKNSGAAIPPEIKQRCESFFEYRLSVGNGEELEQFMFWLESECLDPEWRLRAFLRALDVAKGSNRMSSMFIEGLSNLLTGFPDLVVECFAKLSARALGENYFYLQPEKAKPILRVGLASKNPKTVEAAKKAQENLLRAGHSEYLNLDDPK